MNMVDELILHDDVQYTKQDWRNRNKIKTPKGSKWLTIPVSVTDSLISINAVTVADPNWARNHWGKILSQYSKARHFPDYRQIFEELYLGSGEKYLSQINHRFIKAICEILSIKTRVSWSTDYQRDGGRTEKLVNFCRQAGAGTYLSGPAAKSYMDESLFGAENIKVQWMDYGGYPEYRQMYCPPFVHEVSIIDLIFNEGAEGARNHMLSFSSDPD